LVFTGFILVPPTLAQDSDESSDNAEEDNENTNTTITFLIPTTVPRRSPTTRKESATPLEDMYIERFGSELLHFYATWDSLDLKYPNLATKMPSLSFILL